MKRSIYILLVVMASMPMALAQPIDPLGEKDTLTLENERLLEALEGEKPYIQVPYQEVPKVDPEQFKYQSQDFYVETEFDPPPARSRPVEKDPSTEFYNNFVRLGFGRFLTPLGQIYLNNGRNEKLDYGLNFTHQSAHNDTQIPLREFRRDYGTLSGSITDKRHTYNASLYVYNTAYWFYADTAFSGQEQPRRDSLRMGMTRFELAGGIKSNFHPNSLLEYDLGVKFQHIGERRNNSETHFIIQPSGGYYVTDDLRIGLDLDFDFTSANLVNGDQYRTYLRATPDVRYHTDRLRLRAGINLMLYNNSADTTNTFAVGPMVEAEYQLVENLLTIQAGVTSALHYNHLYDMLYQNPYLADSINYQASLERFNVYVGAKGNIAELHDYSVRVFYKQVSNALVYFAPENGAYFNPLYDSLTSVFGVYGEVNTRFLKNFEGGAAITYQNYATAQLSRFFHGTPIRLDAYGTYTWNEKLIARAKLSIFTPTPVGLTATNQVINRGIFTDLSLYAEYRFIPQFSVYGQVMNLISTQFQRWYNYPERPIDYQVGITFSF